MSAAVDDEDLVLLTLNGLPDKSDTFKTMIRTRVDTISTEELSALLCSKAIHRENKTKLALGKEPTIAYIATK